MIQFDVNRFFDKSSSPQRLDDEMGELQRQKIGARAISRCRSVRCRPVPCRPVPCRPVAGAPDLSQPTRAGADSVPCQPVPCQPGADLSGADLYGATCVPDLSRANLSATCPDLYGADLSRPAMPTCPGADLYGADLSRCPCPVPPTLSRASLSLPACRYRPVRCQRCGTKHSENAHSTGGLIGWRNVAAA